jgi:hypothetical protein
MRAQTLLSAALLGLCATAFAASTTSGSNAGPFPPRADPVLNGPVPPVIAPTSTVTAPALPLDAATVAELTRDADLKRVETMQAERDLDRAERLAKEEQARAANAPPPVAPGAWNGQTDERTR